MDAVAVVGGQPDLDRGHGGDGAGQAHQRAGLGHGRDLAHDVLEVGVGEADAGGQLLGLGRVVVEELLGEPHAADVDRDHALDLVGADDELGRPAADVDDEERARARGRGRRWRRGTTAAPPRRRSAARAARRPHPRPPSKNSSRLAASRAAEVAASRTRSTPWRRAPRGSRAGRRASARRARRPAGRWPPPPGPRRVIVLRRSTMSSLPSPAGRATEHAGRVRADVDRGDGRHGPEPSATGPSSRSWTQRPTGSSPPARNQA